jgi:hypothetical protein
MSDAQPELMSLRVLNEAAIREHALRCSQVCRNGKFTRVGQEFIDEVRADVESIVRAIRVQARTTLHEPVDTAGLGFTTGNLMDRVQHEFNLMVGRVIQNKVQRQTTGKTLTSTR